MIQIPYNPRPAFLTYHASNKRYSAMACHRRSGKTVATINQQIKDILTESLPSPRGLFLAPTFTQAKEIAWNYVKNYSRIIPGVRYLEGELKAILPGDRHIKLGGTEEIDRYRGQYFDSVVLDEFSLMNPDIWKEVIRPAISDRQGRITFIGTPRGQDAFYEICEYAREDSDWYYMKLKASESGILPPEELEANYKLMTPETYAREFEVDFSATFPGAYYAADIVKAQDEGRICFVPHDRAVNVYAAMDLGIGDPTGIWTFQQIVNEWHFLEYYENAGKGLDHYINWMKNRDYAIDMLLLPHDAEARELQSGKSRTDFFRERGINYQVLLRHNIDDGIQAVRMMLNKAYFNKEGTKEGVRALQSYKSEYSGKKQIQAIHPLHDWASHAADSLRYAVMGASDPNRISDWKKPLKRNLHLVA